MLKQLPGHWRNLDHNNNTKNKCQLFGEIPIQMSKTPNKHLVSRGWVPTCLQICYYMSDPKKTGPPPRIQSTFILIYTYICFHFLMQSQRTQAPSFIEGWAQSGDDMLNNYQSNSTTELHHHNAWQRLLYKAVENVRRHRGERYTIVPIFFFIRTGVCVTNPCIRVTRAFGPPDCYKI